MKRITALLLSFALLLLLCACGASTASGGNASSGDAYASWGDASAGDAYASSGNAAGVLPLSATPASTDEPFFCVTLESSRLYAFPAGGGEGRLLVDKYTNCFDQDGDSVLASFDDGSVARVDIRTGEVEEILPAGTQLFHRIHAYSGGFVGEYYSIRESKLFLCENGKEPEEIFSGRYFGDVRVMNDTLVGSDYSNGTNRIIGYALPSLEQKWETPLDAYYCLSANDDDLLISNSYDGFISRVDPTDGSVTNVSGAIYANDNVQYAFDGAYLVEGNYETNFAFYYVRGNERLTLDLPQAETTRYVASARDGKVLISCSASVEAGDYGWTTTTTYIVLDMESAKLYIVDLNGLYSELFADGDFPVMDSSTARKPLVQNIYRFFCLDTGYGGAEPLCSTTHGAWLNIADKKADIALLAAPTDEEKAYLAERGVEVEMKLYGGDGLVFIAPSDKADFCMVMYNADGSRGAMCGNASRCVGKYVYDRGMTDKTVVTLETDSGVKTLNLTVENGRTQSVCVDMGAPILDCEAVPCLLGQGVVKRAPITALGRRFEITPVSMGNPHCVVFSKNIDSINIQKIGAEFENHPAFPDRINTEFVQPISASRIKMRVWERGAGETLSCGTGACAAAVACILNGYCKRNTDIKISLRGGELSVKWSADGNVYLTGSAQTVFTGEIAYGGGAR